MIFQIISIKDVLKKLIIFVVICLSFAFNIFFYNINQEGINYFRPYYAKSYIYSAEHKILTISKSTNSQSQNQNAKSIPVLVYHGVVSKSDGVSIGIDEFKDQMFDLKSQGYQTVRMDDFSKYIVGKKNLPDKSFLLTFDDGRKDSYYPVDPILKELGYSATIFVITGTMDVKSNRFHLVRSEFQKMKDSGRWDLEVHTDKGHGQIPIDNMGNTGHFFSNKMWLKEQNRLETDAEYSNRVKTDLQTAVSKINNDYNTDPIGFAFPYGDYGMDSVNFPESKDILLAEAGKIFSVMFYQTDQNKGFSYNVFGKDSQMIKRIDVDTGWKATDLNKVLAKSKEKDIKLNFDSFNYDQGWIKNWGTFSIRDNKLTLNANEETKGASIFLDGTSSWRNYEYLADINNSGEDTISLLFNYKNDANYGYFSYNSGSIRLVRKENNVDTIIDQARINDTFNNGNILLGVKVRGNMITCTVNNKDYLSADSSTSYGGIGIMVWNEKINTANASVNSIKVKGI